MAHSSSTIFGVVFLFMLVACTNPCLSMPLNEEEDNDEGAHGGASSPLLDRVLEEFGTFLLLYPLTNMLTFLNAQASRFFAPNSFAEALSEALPILRGCRGAQVTLDPLPSDSFINLQGTYDTSFGVFHLGEAFSLGHITGVRFHPEKSVIHRSIPDSAHVARTLDNDTSSFGLASKGGKASQRMGPSAVLGSFAGYAEPTSRLYLCTSSLACNEEDMEVFNGLMAMMRFIIRHHTLIGDGAMPDGSGPDLYKLNKSNNPNPLSAYPSLGK